MRQKIHQKAIDKAAHLLRPGERPMAVGRGGMGRAPVARALGVAAASALLSGGDRIIQTAPEQYFFLLTDQRLLVLESGILYGPTGRLHLELPRHGLTVEAYEPGFVSNFRIRSGDESIRLRFPRSDKKDAEAFARALGLRVG